MFEKLPTVATTSFVAITLSKVREIIRKYLQTCSTLRKGCTRVILRPIVREQERKEEYVQPYNEAKERTVKKTSVRNRITISHRIEHNKRRHYRDIRGP